MSEYDHVRVGVAVVLRSDKGILMGLRKGSFGAGTLGFPGGKLEKGESVYNCARREMYEETGLILATSGCGLRKLTFTNDVFVTDDKHFITLYMAATKVGAHEARVMEPDKCERWEWWHRPPPRDVLFLPVRNLLESGFGIWP